MTTKDHKLAAIVFTDMVGFTKQMEKSEGQTMQLLQKQREIVFPIVKSHEGEIIKEIGDGLFMIFNSAFEAVHCAIDIQKRLKDEDLTIRAGIHIGDVVFKGGDVFGSAVNVAARLETIAPPNGICMSGDVRSQVKNKEDIRTVSSGKKYLKGVIEPVEVHCVILDEVIGEGANGKVSILKDLWQRRVVQILVSYLIISLLIRFSVSSLVSNFVLSPHLTNLIWIVMLSFIPTVILVSWFHGKNRARWGRLEKISLPANLIFAILLAVFLFKGKDLGAATEIQVYENEQGEKIERVISKSEFRKKIALFFFENNSGDTSLNWLQYAIPSMLEYDLSQEIFIQAHPPTEYMYRFKDAGYKEGVGAPWMLQKNIAGFYNLNYFVSGTFDFVGGQFILHIKLYDTESGELVSGFEIDGENIFEVIDKLSVNLFIALEVPSCQAEGSRDLPISDIYTSSVKAARYYSKGNIEIILNNNWDKAIDYTEKAIKEDPGFALAHLTLVDYYFNNNNTEEAESALQDVVGNIYKLPERKQFFARFVHYIIKQQPDKAMAVLNMWAELIPGDIEVHDILATRYQYRNMYAESIGEYRAILSLDPYQTKYISFIGDLHQALGNYDSAMIYFEHFARLNPGDFKTYWNLGELYLHMADFDLAANYLDKALLIELGEVNVSLSRIEVDRRLGKFENCEGQYMELLKNCKTINDSCKVYNALSDYFELKGQVNRSLNYHRKFLNGIEKTEDPQTFMVDNILSIDKYLIAGEVDEAYRILNELENKFQPPVDKVAAFGYINYYIETDSPENAERFIQEAKDLAIDFGEEILLAKVIYAEARINELKNDYDQALEYYVKYQQNKPLEADVYRLIARCYRKLGNFKKAEKNILTALKHNPYEPKTNYEAALIFKEKGKQEKAKEYQQRALGVWKDADEEYKPAGLAKDLAEGFI